MNLELEGKTAIVTGGSRGIGLAIAARLLEAGAQVMLSSRSDDNLAEAKMSLLFYGDLLDSHVAHVGRRADAEGLVAATLERFGAVDILVNNAGTNPYYGPLVDIDDVRMQKTFEINQASIVTHTRAAWNGWMKQHGGAIVNIASIGGYGVEPGIGWYNVTKAAVIHLTKQFAYELAPRVRVNGIAPGLVKTELARELWEQHEERIAAQIPLRRLGEPDDIATAALFLLSNEASWLTGQTLIVDGGATNQPSGGIG